MITRYCSICSTSFDREIEGEEGSFGMIQFAFCGECRVGVIEWVKNFILEAPDED